MGHTVVDSTSPVRGRGLGIVLLTAGLILISGAGWWLTSPDAVRGGYGRPGAAGTIAMGESMYVGQLGIAKRTVVATSIRPQVTDGLEAAVFVCHRDSSYGASVHSGDRSDIDAACARLVPATGDTLVEAHPADTYVVIEVTRTGSGPQRLCGVDIRYRDGWRRGNSRSSGEDVVFDVGDDPLDDPAQWPECP